MFTHLPCVTELLDAVKLVLPTGADEWRLVLSKYMAAAGAKETRTWEALKKQFEVIVKTPAQTGSVLLLLSAALLVALCAHCPLFLLR